MSISSRLQGHPGYIALCRSFDASLPGKVQAIETAAAEVLCPTAGPEDVRSLFRLVHRLTGSAAIYGHGAVSRASGALEDLLWPFGSAQAQRPVDAAAFENLVKGLRRALVQKDEEGEAAT